MLIVRFRVGDATRYGELEGATIVEYSGTPWSAFRRGRRRHSPHQVVLLAPVLPSKIVAVGLNYRARAAELAEPLPELPVLALKPPSAVIGPDDPIVLPPQSDLVEHEAELAVVLKRRCRPSTGTAELSICRSPTCTVGAAGTASCANSCVRSCTLPAPS